MTRMVKIQLVLFTILGLVAMLYAVAKYARLPRVPVSYTHLTLPPIYPA